MLFINQTINYEEQKEVENTIREFDNEEASSVSKYLNSLVCNCYQKAVEDIENTQVSNKLTRKRNLKQAMRESFFYGANRFGNNFIA